MSATHILNIAGGIRCGRLEVRGFISYHDYMRLSAEGKLRTRHRSTINHVCAYREGGKCYTNHKKTMEASCIRRRDVVPGFCRDCVERGER